jgi:hypothetical protein
MGMRTGEVDDMAFLLGFCQTGQLCKRKDAKAAKVDFVMGRMESFVLSLRSSRLGVFKAPEVGLTFHETQERSGGKGGSRYRGA